MIKRGPVDVVVMAAGAPRFEGKAFAELKKQTASGTIRVLDAMILAATGRATDALLEAERLNDRHRALALSEVTISELMVDEGGEVRVEDIFRFKAEGVDENLLVTGSFHPTGHVPRFLEELVDRGEAEVDLEISKE